MKPATLQPTSLDTGIAAVGARQTSNRKARSNLPLTRQCPRFDRCSANRCPLAVAYPNQIVDKDDRERRCPMEKGVRLRIASSDPGRLKLSGLTVPEHAAALAFERKPLAVKLQMANRGKASLAKINRGKDVQNA